MRLTRSLRATSIAVVVASSVAASGCGSFEDAAIVIDLRLVSMVAEPPEQLVAFDPQAPPDPATLMLAPMEVCARVGDPADLRSLAYSMRVCPIGDDLRCDPDRPLLELTTGTIDDPETAPVEQVMCATVPGGSAMLPLIADAIAEDTLGGFGGIDLIVELRVVPVGGGEDTAIYGSKRIRYAAQLPAERRANANPTVERFEATINDGPATTLVHGRCRDQATPLTVTVGDEVKLDPFEPEGAREDYVVPTFDGGSRMFTESLTYQWLAGDGEFSRGGTGGPPDPFGNDPPLDTVWRTPPAEEVTETLDVPLWINQRDERLGATFYQSCVRVMPAAP
jgi:hypothetical protein